MSYFTVRVNYATYTAHVVQEAPTVPEAVHLVSRLRPDALSWECPYIVRRTA